MPHLIYIVFVFALGACVGSFLNVVVWRIPNIEYQDDPNQSMFGQLFRGFFTTMKALSDPPSHCPKCDKRLKWYDNIPVLGWIKLGGKCRFCKAPISKRYPIIEAITGLLFVGYYVAYFMLQTGPCAGVSASGHENRPALILHQHAWLYGLDMALLSALLAASLIDAEYFIIPLEIPWAIVPFAIAAHAFFDQAGGPGNVAYGPLPSALAVGAAVGTVLSLILVNFKILPSSFAEGDPLLDVERKELEEERKRQEEKERKKNKKKKKNRGNDSDAERERAAAKAADSETERQWTPAEIRREIRKEMLFLFPPLALAMLCMVLVLRVESIGHWWDTVVAHQWVASLLGSILGGLAGGFIIWFTRIIGSIVAGRQAMGMGDVDLMVAIGTVIGVGPVIVVFFAAPFFGIAFSLYLLFSRKSRELPYGPYLSLAAAFVMLFYCPIAAYFAPGLANAEFLLGRLINGG